MLTLEDTAVAAPSPATLRRARTTRYETTIWQNKHEVEARDLLRSALDTTDPGLRKLNCTLLRTQHHLTRWWNVKTGQMIGEQE